GDRRRVLRLRARARAAAGPLADLRRGSARHDPAQGLSRERRTAAGGVAMTPRASRALAASSLQSLLAVLLAASVLAAPPASAAPPSYEVAHTLAPSKALLAADDKAWTAGATIAWGPAPYETRFRALWSQDGLYLRYDVDDASPWHTMTRRDEHIWQEE